MSKRSGPSSSLLRFAAKILPDEGERRQFLEALVTPLPYAPALVWMNEPQSVFELADKPRWAPDWVQFLAPGQRPGQHPLHEEGAYYVLDPSSVFSAAAFLDIQAESILDVCASPGGKSVQAWRALQPKTLVANEVIGKRLGMLRGNLERCGVKPSEVVSLDAAKLAEDYQDEFDLVIVDAPCSGQSLFVKGRIAPGAFMPHVIDMNAQRQRRILANAVQCVKTGGHLAYMTCTYSREENEGTVEWLLKRFPEMSPITIDKLQGCEGLSDWPSYRLWPQRGEGAGAFVTMLGKHA